MKSLKSLIREILLQESSFDCSSLVPPGHRGRYYSIDPNNPPPIDDIIDGWSNCDLKLYDEDYFHAYYPPSALLPFREYKWSRETAGGLEVKGRTGSSYQDKWHFVPDAEERVGAQKWDAMVQKMKESGWNPRDPAHVHIGSNGTRSSGSGKGNAKVGEGNHRLAIALELDIPVPVMFHFRGQVHLSDASNI
jgi:hypothetical protein